MENVGRLAGFVGLQVADHVERNVVQPSQRGKLLPKFLHAIFAEQTVSGGVGFEDCVGWKRFGHSHQRDVGMVSACTLRGAIHTVADGGEIFSNSHLCAVA